MKKVYVSPEVECINFYSEEEITSDGLSISVTGDDNLIEDSWN